MKKRFIAILMIATFALGTTACAKDVNKILEEDAVVEASVEASEEASEETVEEAVEEASEEASEESSDEASEEASEESSEGKDTSVSLEGVDPDKVYKNEEFGVALVIDDNMTFSGEDVLKQMSEDGKESFGADSGNPLLEAFSYTNKEYLAHAESPTRTLLVDVSVADLSDLMEYPVDAYAEMSAVRIRVGLEDEFDAVESSTSKEEIMGEERTVVTVTTTQDGHSAYMTELYLMQDKRLFTVTVYTLDKDDAARIYGNLVKLD